MICVRNPGTPGYIPHVVFLFLPFIEKSGKLSPRYPIKGSIEVTGMNKKPTILLIAGTGRNSGKTTLAVAIIARFSHLNDLVAVKISPHFHRGKTDLIPIEQNSRYNIYRDPERQGSKDSQRMAKAGADRVFYVEVRDTHLREAFEKLLELIPPDSPVIIESPALGQIVKPGVYIIADHPRTVNKKEEVLASKAAADHFINTAAEDIGIFTDRLHFDAAGWHLDVK